MKTDKVLVEKERSVDKKTVRDEKRSVELWGVLVGLPLWLVLFGIFYGTGLYIEWGKSALLRFYGDDPNIVFTLITFPGSIAIMVASTMGAIKLSVKTRRSDPFRIAVAESVDLFLWLNSTAVWMGMSVHYTFYQSIPILELVIANLITLLPPIVGFAVILDFVMPKLWNRLFGCNCGYFQGKLLKNLKQSWRKSELQRDFRKSLVGGLILMLCVSVLVVVLALMGLL